MPFEQHPDPATALNIVAPTCLPDPPALAQTMERKIRARNPDVPVKVSTMEGTLWAAVAAPRFQMCLIVLFAAVGIVLALAGIYAVMAYTVSQRIPELGVRIALGATPAQIMGLVMRVSDGTSGDRRCLPTSPDVHC